MIVDNKKEVIKLNKVLILEHEGNVFINIVYNKNYITNFKLKIENNKLNIYCKNQENNDYKFEVAELNRKMELTLNSAKNIYLNQLNHSGRSIIKRDRLDF